MQIRLAAGSVVLASLVHFHQALAASFSYKGCYSTSAFSGSGSSYTYQSAGHCKTQCGSYKYAALTGGNVCLCSNSAPSGSKVSDSNCDSQCSGYPADICGGGDYYSVWTSSTDDDDGDGDGSSSSSDSSSTATDSNSSSGSSSTDAGASSAAADSSASGSASATASDDVTASSGASTSTITSTATGTHKTSSSLAKPTTIESTSLSVNTDDSGQTVTSAIVVKTTASYSDVYVTLTASASGSSGSNGSDSANNGTNGKNAGGSGSGLSGGAIAGIVVGVVAAVAIFVSVLVFIWRQRQKSRDLEKSSNAAIAATVVANNYSSRHPERNRFSGLRDDFGNDDDEDGALGPIIGSTGDGNNTNNLSGSASTNNDGFSRNPSSRFNNNNNSNNIRQEGSALGIHQGVGPAAAAAAAGAGAGAVYANNNRSPAASSNIRRSGSQTTATDYNRHSSEENQRGRFSNEIHHELDNEDDAAAGATGDYDHDQDDDEFDFTDPSAAPLVNPPRRGAGLRIMNPDNESIKSGHSATNNIGGQYLDPKNHQNHQHTNSGISTDDQSDDDLFRDRVRD